MSTREKVIVVLAVLLGVYGIYVLFFEDSGGGGRRTPTPVAEQTRSAEAVAGQVKSTVQEDRPTESEMTILAKAQEPWRSDPFYTRSAASRASEEREPEPEISFTYNGFVAFDDSRYAVVNGQEYTIGEELETGGYFMRTILPDKVIIQGKRGEITVPLTEETY